MSSENQALSGFVSIGQDVYLSRPVTSIPNEARDPTVIIIFGWMGAQPSHLKKYTAVYEELYPSSTQVLVRCHWSTFWTTQVALRNRVMPVLELLEDRGCIPVRVKLDDFSSVLVHVFSFGGLYQLHALHQLIALRHSVLPMMPSASSYATPRAALILDSSPTYGGLASAIRSFTAAIKNPVVWCIIVAFLCLDHWIRQLLIFLRILPKGDWIYRICMAFNTPSVRASTPQGRSATFIPWMTQDAPRLYLYSRKDELVAFRDVERHAAEAKAAAGLRDVRLETFEDTPHVAHATKYPDRYWGAVKDLWRSVTGEI
ncbi:hypothetical protein BDN72DRAFT_882181 [Pluteus cervinus]|uniref:Uncharacterized protein n=1 Tax=Pluteus cervinus TaxID=181527 RepID=A0ACD3ADA2_9AGAR|nr:hypothetical protein BDN72DRAFT_882181 [Pluteus cervinus]